jgi:hypothetical protein
VGRGVAIKTVKIQGGLGNQLFGLAFARSVAIFDEGPVALDLASYEREPYGRRFELMDFARSLGAFVMAHRPLTGARLTHAAGRLLPLPGFVAEGRRPRDEAALREMVSRGRYFSGYWQDEAFMADAARFRAQVRRLMEARGPRAPTGAVVIHYRTYKEERRRRARRTPPGRFFVEALDLIERRVGAVDEVVLVSDDPALARGRLGDLGRRVVTPEPASPWEDLALMARARGLILTNSSFSWWGGFCSDAPCVVYPRPDGYAHYPKPSARFACL